MKLCVRADAWVETSCEFLKKGSEGDAACRETLSVIDFTENLFNNFFSCVFGLPKHKNLGVFAVKRKTGLRALGILISLLVFLSPAYSCYVTLTETNPSSADMGYESPDQDGLSMSPYGDCRGFAASAPSVSFFPVNNLFKWLIDSFCQTLSTDHKPFVIRC